MEEEGNESTYNFLNGDPKDPNILFHSKVSNKKDELPFEMTDDEEKEWKEELSNLIDKHDNGLMIQKMEQVRELFLNFPHQKKIIQQRLLTTDFLQLLNTYAYKHESQTALFILSQLIEDPIPEFQNSIQLFSSILEAIRIKSMDSFSLYPVINLLQDDDMYLQYAFNFIYIYIQKNYIDIPIISTLLDILSSFNTINPITLSGYIQVISVLFEHYTLNIILQENFSPEKIFTKILQFMIDSNNSIHNISSLLFSDLIKKFLHIFQSSLDILIPQKYYINHESTLDDDILFQPALIKSAPENWFIPNFSPSLVEDVKKFISSNQLIDDQEIQREKIICIHWLLRFRFPLLANASQQIEAQNQRPYQQNPTSLEVQVIHNCVGRLLETREFLTGPKLYDSFLELYGTIPNTLDDAFFVVKIVNAVMNFQNPNFFAYLNESFTVDKIKLYLSYFISDKRGDSMNQIALNVLRIVNKMIRVEPYYQTLISDGILPLIFSFIPDATFKMLSLCTRILLWGLSYINTRELIDYLAPKNQKGILSVATDMIQSICGKSLNQLLESLQKFLDACQSSDSDFQTVFFQVLDNSGLINSIHELSEEDDLNSSQSKIIDQILNLSLKNNN